MRRVLLTLLTLAVAGSALAAQPPAPPKPKPKPAPVQAPAETPSVVLAPPIPLAVGRPGGDPMQCKSTCARILYFCNANGDDDCGSRWAQCTSACSATYSPVKFGR